VHRDTGSIGSSAPAGHLFEHGRDGRVVTLKDDSVARILAEVLDDLLVTADEPGRHHSVLDEALEPLAGTLASHAELGADRAP
jgi:hypothetical protein